MLGLPFFRLPEAFRKGRLRMEIRRARGPIRRSPSFFEEGFGESAGLEMVVILLKENWFGNAGNPPGGEGVIGRFEGANLAGRRLALA